MVSINYHDLKIKIRDQLKPLKLDDLEFLAWFNLIAYDLFGLSKVDLIMADYLEMTLRRQDRLDEIVIKLLNNYPIQYVLGHCYFGSLNLVIEPDVFIPRSDTLELVDRTADIINLKEGKFTHVLEVGVGSGAISISLLKKFCNLKITAIDINPKACAITHKNALIHNVAHRLKIYNCDFVNFLKFYKTCAFNGIIANPPYINDEDYNNLPKPILQFESKLALNGIDSDGLGFYRMLSANLPILACNSFLALEIGDNQGVLVQDVLKLGQWCDINLYRDTNGLNRVITAWN